MTMCAEALAARAKTKEVWESMLIVGSAEELVGWRIVKDGYLRVKSLDLLSDVKNVVVVVVRYGPWESMLEAFGG
jgi:hypothetical protein